MKNSRAPRMRRARVLLGGALALIVLAGASAIFARHRAKSFLSQMERRGFHVRAADFRWSWAGPTFDDVRIQFDHPYVRSFECRRVLIGGWRTMRGLIVTEGRLNIDGSSKSFPIFKAAVLFDRLQMDRDDRRIAFSLVAQSKDLEMKAPWLADDIASFAPIGVRAQGEWRYSSAPSYVIAAEMTSAGCNLRAGINGNRDDHGWASTTILEIREADMGRLYRALPPSLRGPLATAELSGTIDGDIGIYFHDGCPKDRGIQIALNQDWEVQHVPPSFDPARLMDKFAWQIYDQEGERHSQWTGPGTEQWTSYEDMSPWIPIAVMGCEDDRFKGHNGIFGTGMEDAMNTNLRQGRWAAGGSTITQQLAKNLWLNRHRTIARKIQEAVLARYLEQCFDKERILELYVNVVEFGPDIYGIRNGALHYFHCEPAQLNFAQSLILAYQLPGPGRLLPGLKAWAEYKFEFMFERGLISGPQRDQGRRELLDLWNSEGPVSS